MTYEIRSAAAPDLDIVAALYEHLHARDLPVDPEQLQLTFDRIVRSPQLHIYLLEEAGIAKASCYLNIIENLTRGAAPYGVIENVVTHRDYRRQGLAKAVLGHALLAAWSAGCYKVMLMTGQQELIPFYEACGFDALAKHALLARPG